MRNLIKNLVLVMLLSLCISCGSIVKGLSTVTSDFYVANIDGYQLIFEDTKGRVKIATDYITVKKVSKNKSEEWFVTTRLEDALISIHAESVIELKDADVIKIPTSKIKAYTREVH